MPDEPKMLMTVSDLARLVDGAVRAARPRAPEDWMTGLTLEEGELIARVLANRVTMTVEEFSAAMGRAMRTGAEFAQAAELAARAASGRALDQMAELDRAEPSGPPN